MPAGTSIHGVARDASSWIGEGFNLRSNTGVTDLEMDGAGVANYGIVTDQTTLVEGAYVERCLLRDWSTAAICARNATGGVVPRWLRVDDNLFFDNAYSLLAEGVRDVSVTRNVSRNAAGTGRHFFGFASDGGVFSGNRTFGGIVGIGFLADRNVASTRLIRGNMISGNVVTDASEEGISLDLTGNTGTRVALIDWGTVSSSTWTSLAGLGQLVITLDAAFAGAAANRFFGYQAVVTTGTSQGFVGTIAASNGQTITINNVVEATAQGIMAGDEVQIGIPMVGNSC